MKNIVPGIWIRKALIFFILVFSYLGIIYGFAWKYHNIYKKSPESYFVSKEIEQALGHKEANDLLEDISPIIPRVKQDSIFMNDEPELYKQMIAAEEQRKLHQLPKSFTLTYKHNFDDFLFFSATIGNSDIRPSSREVRKLIVIQNIIMIFYSVIFVNFSLGLLKKRSSIQRSISNKRSLNNVKLDDLLKVGIPKSIAEDIINFAPYKSSSDLVNRVNKIGIKRLAIILDNFDI